jgi:hypothetical protein
LVLKQEVENVVDRLRWRLVENRIQINEVYKVNYGYLEIF